jgi:hypothetical protein
MLVQVGKRGGFPDPTHTARVFKKLLYNYHRELTYLQVLLQKPFFFKGTRDLNRYTHYLFLAVIRRGKLYNQAFYEVDRRYKI